MTITEGRAMYFDLPRNRNQGGKMLEEMDAFEALMWEFGYPHFKDDIDAYPFFARLVDWEKAKTIYLPSFPGSGTEMWEVMRAVGFAKNRVLQLIDPALVPLADRMLDLPIMTLSSCSGHPDLQTFDRNFSGSLEFIFRDSGFGKEFVRQYRRICKGSRYMKLEGGSAATIANVNPKTPFKAP